MEIIILFTMLGLGLATLAKTSRGNRERDPYRDPRYQPTAPTAAPDENYACPMCLADRGQQLTGANQEDNQAAIYRHLSRETQRQQDIIQRNSDLYSYRVNEPPVEETDAQLTEDERVAVWEKYFEGRDE